MASSITTAFLLVAVDAFEDDDGVVDHHPYRQCECQGGEVVERETEEAHEAEGGNERGRDRERDDKGGAPRTQEDEDHQDGQHGAINDVYLDVFDGLLHVLCSVEGDVVEKTGWKVLGELVHPLAGRAVDVYQVGAGARGDTETEGWRQVVARHAAFIGNAKLGEADVGKAYRPAVDGRDDKVVEVLHCFKKAEVAYRQLGQWTFDEPAGKLEVFAT
jgi:hypothetical protein